MIRSCDEILGYAVAGNGAMLGWVRDFLVDERWQVNYVVVDTGRWLPGRRLLFPPELLDAPDWRSRSICGSRALHAALEYEGAPVDELYSLRSMLRYAVHASDGQAGMIRDFVIIGDAEFSDGWRVDTIVTRLGWWAPAPLVGITPDRVVCIEPTPRFIRVNGDLQSLNALPEFDPGAPVQSHVEVRMLDYRGRVVPEQKA